MKNLVQLFIVIMFFIACDNSPKTEMDSNEMDSTETKDSMGQNPLVGAWELVGYYNYENNEVIDSFDQRDGFRQVKMYTPTKVMWSKQVPTDSTEWFGYGTYKIEDGQLVEVLDYGSKMMTTIIQEREEFIFDLAISENTFSQIEIDEEGNKIYAENYKRIE